MKREVDNTYTVESNIGGDPIDLSIAEDAMVHIMDILTNLYSNRIRAVVREYSANALDAHIEAGHSDPIEVTLPTSLAPFFTVKDHGIGLSHDDIRDIYSKYGASTKTNTDSQTGMLGLGCKSALTYSPQFTLVGVKNGQRCMVSVSRNEEGVGSMNVIEEVPATDPNGVEIIVPVQEQDIVRFAREVEHVFSYWSPNTVLVNGEPPKRLTGHVITPDITLLSEDQGHSDIIIMGNVAYPVDHSHRYHGLDNWVVARVPIGTVKFTPSREQLDYTPKTVAALKSISEQITPALSDFIRKQVSKAPDATAAMKLTVEYRKAYPARYTNKLKYRGKEIPIDLSLPNDAKFTVTKPYSGKLTEASRESAIPFQTALNALWIYDWDQAGLTPATKKKLNKYGDEHKITSREHYVLIHNFPTEEMKHWISPDRFVHWPTIQAIKLPRKSGGRVADPNRIRGSFDMFIDGQERYGVLASEIDTTIPLYYYVGSLSNTTYLRQKIDLLHGGGPFTLVAFFTNRTAKFLRMFPEAQSVHNVGKQLIDTFVEYLTEEEKTLIAFERNYTTRSVKANLRKLKPHRLIDPELQRLVRLAKQAPPKHLVSMANQVDCYHMLSFKNPLEKYPLVEAHHFQTHPAHSYLYVNAAYRGLISKSKKRKHVN